MSPNTVNSMADEPDISYMKLVKYYVFLSKDNSLSKKFAIARKSGEKR